MGPEDYMKYVRVWTSLLVVFFVLLTGCTGYYQTPERTFYTSTTEIPVSGPEVPGVTRYDDSIKQLMVQWNLPGLTLAVVRNGKLIVARGYGYSDFDAKLAMKPAARMRIASASKTFTAAAILHLVEQGKLSLDDRFLNVLTQYQLPANADQRLGTITIRQLLQHSGGWDRDISGDPIGMPWKVEAALNVLPRVTCSQTITYMLSQKLDFNPGERYAYSNFGYCILGRVIEKASGKRYEEYVRDEVLSPIDIHAMSIGHTARSQLGLNEVVYYDFSRAPFYTSVLPGGGNVEGPYGVFPVETGDASGGWVASAIDLTRFMTALDGTRRQFLRPATVVEFTAKPDLVTQNPNPPWNGTERHGGWYGMGIFAQPDTQGLTWWHWGNMPGTHAVMLRNGRGYTWAALVNTMPKDIGHFMNVLDVLLWNAHDAGVEDSPTNMYPQFPSPEVPASDVQN
jgi:CubicO group peptidase (beta-lactamase class C family)